MAKYQNKTQAIIDLQKRGYDHDFILSKEFIFCVQKGERMFPDDFEIIGAYRFGNDRLPKSQGIIFAISSAECDLKGILMSSYHCYAKGISIHLWSKLVRHLAQ